MVRDREAAEDDVAEEMTAQVPHRRHDPAHAERRADLLGLAGAGRAGPNHFLQRDDVGIDVAQHFGNALRRRAPIHAAAAMDVVGRDSELDVGRRFRLGHCCRSRIQMNGPTIFSQSGRRRQASSVTSWLARRSRW